MFKNMSPVLLTTLVAVLVLVIAAPFLRSGPVRDGQIGLEIGVPENHILTQDLQLPIVLRLHNRSDQDIRLEAENLCKVFRFVITNHIGTFIQASGTNKDCEISGSAQPVSEMLLTGDVREEIQIIPLDAHRFQPGQYEIQAKYWGHITSAKFALADSE